MTPEQLAQHAKESMPFLNWVGTTDGSNGMGTGMPFAGATVGTSLGPATINLVAVNGTFVAELVVRQGQLSTGPENALILQSAQNRTAKAAYDNLINLAKGAASMVEGLKLAESQHAESTEGRLEALGLVVPSSPVTVVGG